ncbi:hypothetical protein BDE18_3874 [Paracoccus pantotrophus]|uniref:Alpha/beta hydrolase n=1 Tax=Paracoccus pantotrophus TaxID=82367 RepID=A0AAE6NWM7_PARPN|nr:MULTISPECIES: hypothetical protein [Paracoccus]MDF3907735.1 hypothetical protein [Paracoccus sp. AS002]QFG36467.1 hypothetical protein ESD82_09695 [Paracoccus pantotrophus]RKS42945.1 hypothetical protein BDE18_3874 [Paracoccus pantotrophus]
MRLLRFLTRRKHIGEVNASSDFVFQLSNHRLQYTAGGRTLIVSFDNAARPLNEKYVGRHTWGQKFYLGQGHSLLGVIARRRDWYRRYDLIEAFEAIKNQGFFESFSNVVFTGGSMGGYAAAAFAPFAPGCKVVAYSPQSTLKPDITPWENRFPEGTRQNWSLPFWDGADGVRHAGLCYIIYDNLDTFDRRHADRLSVGPHVVNLPIPGAGHGGAPMLNQIGIFKEVNRAMIAGKLDPKWFFKTIRARRGTLLYREVLANHALARNHPTFAECVHRLAGP